MKYKSGAYSGEKYADGSMWIWKNGKLICEFYISVSAGNKDYHFTLKNFESICTANEKNCNPFKEEKQ